MSIFVDKNTRLLVQGITGKEGRFHALQCVAYGTNVVAGVTPGKGGGKIDGIPVFNTVGEAVDKTGANCSMIFVPPQYATDAIMEAADNGIEIIVAIT
ncbi:MAG: succinate--CoA ligase subunit alpha, partial [Proteobacteria bacterium]|nr:succinate--CoA ligase subunit alpha [Pseudomonadota bacterium]